MNYGFFSSSELKPRQGTMPHLAQCGRCKMAPQCHSPRMPYHGKGQRKILVIGEAPGKNEDEQNEQFVGKAGKRLQRELARFGVDLNRDCWKTNAVRCYPSDGKTPKSKIISFCRPALFSEIRHLKPESILLFGSVPAESVIGHLWGSGGKMSMHTWTHWLIPHQELNAWISVHYHPSFLERQSDDLLNLLFRRDLEQALAKKLRPWKHPPNYIDQIELIYKSSQVAKALQDFQKLIAVDYETNCLKPEYPGAEIISCAIAGNVSGKERVIAFPWTGEIKGIMSTLLRSGIRKVASNAKFEERWTRFVFGHGVRNWDWDTMLAAHVLNNATGVTSCKFQAFVRLGQPPYNKHIEPFLKPGRGHYLNRIREIPLSDLLTYMGMDSLLEYKLAVLQKREMENGRPTNNKSND